MAANVMDSRGKVLPGALRSRAVVAGGGVAATVLCLWREETLKRSSISAHRSPQARTALVALDRGSTHGSRGQVVPLGPLPRRAGRLPRSSSVATAPRLRSPFSRVWQARLPSSKGSPAPSRSSTSSRAGYGRTRPRPTSSARPTVRPTPGNLPQFAGGSGKKRANIEGRREGATTSLTPQI